MKVTRIAEKINLNQVMDISVVYPQLHGNTLISEDDINSGIKNTESI